MNTATVTEYNSVDLANTINAEIAAGKTVTINGDKVVAFHGTPKVTAWNNGTISYDTPAATKGKIRTFYIKVGNAINWTAI